jgi:two-component system KDP operon response regulator KdpE
VTASITIVLIEDETPMRRFLRAAFGTQGMTLIEAPTAREGLAQVAGRRPDLVLLDLGLPDLDGLEVVRRIREWSAVPIIVLSARGREGDKVAALDAGADDYLTKPFGVDELLARIRVALRHAVQQASPEPVVTVGPVRIDFGARTVHRDGVELRLTPTEWRLLAVLAQHAGKVITHRQLLREVWGLHTDDQIHYLRVYAAQLRRKLEVDPSRPQLLVTEPGVGYRLRAE